jgi:hypothetical protein
MKPRAVWSGIAIALLAIALAHMSIDGLFTGETRALSKNPHPPATGLRGVIVAVSYAMGATALALVAAACLTANEARGNRFFATAKWLGIAALVVLCSSLLAR